MLRGNVTGLTRLGMVGLLASAAAAASPMAASTDSGVVNVVAESAAARKSEAAVARRDEGGGNVILVTLDGVRWEEMFRGEDVSLGGAPGRIVFESLWSALVEHGLLFGNRLQGGEVLVDNPVTMSLPAYQSIMAGRVMPCFTNGCGRIDRETLAERLAREKSLGPREMAVISSWSKIEHAVQHKEGVVNASTGMEPFDDGTGDPVHGEFNRRQSANPPPWSHARFDRFTMAHALHYLKKNQPRFLFVSFNDPDEWAHRKDYPNYLESLRELDRWLLALAGTIQEMGDYGRNTTLIVTTDHGRGEGKGWHQHGMVPRSRYIWLYAAGPHVKGSGNASGEPRVSHIDLRPTIETLLGMEPVSCDGCGQPINRITGD